MNKQERTKVGEEYVVAIENVEFVDADRTGRSRRTHRRTDSNSLNAPLSQSSRERVNDGSFEGDEPNRSDQYIQQQRAAYAQQQAYLQQYYSQQQQQFPGYPQTQQGQAQAQAYAVWMDQQHRYMQAQQQYYQMQQQQQNPQQQQQQQQQYDYPPTQHRRAHSSPAKGISGTHPLKSNSSNIFQPEKTPLSSSRPPYYSEYGATAPTSLTAKAKKLSALVSPRNNNLMYSHDEESGRKTSEPNRDHASGSSSGLPPVKSHRPSHSDAGRPSPIHRRSFSEGLPPKKVRISSQPPPTDPARFHRKPFDNYLPRSRSFSTLGSSKSGHIRRGSSGAASAATSASHVSFVTDIRKSTLFRGVNLDTGEALLHYPFERVHLTMNPSLTPGVVYQIPNDESLFEEYHRVAYEIELDEFGLDSPLACNCGCTNCNNCIAKQELLPLNYYILPVEEDLYRRVIDEICESRLMPLGTFFCGHHEDVSRPSIVIAILLLVVTGIGMGCVASVYQA